MDTLHASALTPANTWWRTSSVAGLITMTGAGLLQWFIQILIRPMLPALSLSPDPTVVHAALTREHLLLASLTHLVWGIAIGITITVIWFFLLPLPATLTRWWTGILIGSTVVSMLSMVPLTVLPPTPLLPRWMYVLLQTMVVALPPSGVQAMLLWTTWATRLQWWWRHTIVMMILLYLLTLMQQESMNLLLTLILWWTIWGCYGWILRTLVRACLQQQASHIPPSG